MDHWISDDSIFISRKSGTPAGIVQVYRHILPDLLMGDYSFTLIDEADSPSAIAPSVMWDHSAYLRLIEFLEYSSAMVSASGHVVLRSQLRIGGRDGPTTYWRCLDLLPMHIFGLLKPVDTGTKPKFLIVGGDVEKAVADDWKSKYDTLDTAYNTLMTDLTACQLENGRLVDDSKAYKKHKDDVDQLKNSVTKTVSDEISEKELDGWAVERARGYIQENIKLRKETSLALGYRIPAQLDVKPSDIGSARLIENIEMFGLWSVYIEPTEE